MVSSEVRVRFAWWREDRPLSRCEEELSEACSWSFSSSSSSEKLCLRFVLVAGIEGVGEEAGGGLEAVAAVRWVGPGIVVGAENSGEVEAWEFGRIGRAEVTGDGGFGGISSARTNAGESYPQLLRIDVGMSECRELARVPGAK